MPVSKKRKKKRTKSYGPPPSKKELAAKSKGFSRQQILIVVISALVILSMAIGFVVSGFGRTSRAVQPTSNVGQEILLPSPQATSSTGGEDQGSAGQATPVEAPTPQAGDGSSQ